MILMSEMQFNEEQTSTRYIPAKKSDGIKGFLISKGFAKDEPQANYILLGIIGIMVIIFFITISSGAGDLNAPTYEERANSERPAI
jgi:hypothetical protein